MKRFWAVLAACTVVLGIGSPVVPRAGAVEGDVGYVGPAYTGTSAPTGQKPQSKLWFAHDQWWGVLWDVVSRDFHIFGYDSTANAWYDTGVLVDTRANLTTDVMYDGSLVYVLSAGSSSTDSTHSPKLRRYHFDATADSWLLDPGFPKQIANGGAEAFVLDKDSTGRLWVTYTQGSKVLITHSGKSDTEWVGKFELPAHDAQKVSPDDISSVVAFDGDKIGVLWSNQQDGVFKMYWAWHRDADGDKTWSTAIAYDMPEGADDHINLKSLVGDDHGRVYAMVKTSMNHPDDPLIHLLVLHGDETWTSHVFATKAEDLTRGIVLIDTAHRLLYGLAAGPCCAGGTVYYKTTSLDAPDFTTSSWVPFINSAAHPEANNVTSTKQNLTDASGLMALAGDDQTRTYLYNLIPPDVTGPDTTPPETAIESGPDPETTDTQATFTFTASESATFGCELDGAAAVPCASPYTLTDLSVGDHVLRLTATDAAGNADSTPPEWHWSVQPIEVPVLVDDFATLDGWEVLVGGGGTATIEAGAVHPGDPGLWLTSTALEGSTASVRRTLTEPLTALQLDVSSRVVVARATQEFSLLKLYDATGSRLLSLTRTGAGDLYVRDRVTSSPQVAAPALDAVAHLTLEVTVRDGVDSWRLSVNGVSVAASDTADLGSLAVARVRLGEDSLRRELDQRFDDLVVSR